MSALPPRDPSLDAYRRNLRANLDAPLDADGEHPVVADAWAGGDLKPDAPADADALRAVEVLERDGFVVLPSLVPPERCDALRAALDRIDQPLGRNRFEGYNTRRINTVYGKTSAADEFILHPRVLAVLDRVLQPGFLLSACQAVEIMPGEKAQPLHYDCSYIRIPRPRRAVLVNVFWAIDDYSAQNGGTKMIPGSHLWGQDRLPDPAKDPIVPTAMPKGSCVIFYSTTWHAGGANKTSKPRMALGVLYGEPFIRQLETAFGVLHPKQVARLPRRLREMLGYSTVAPNIGNIDGRSPLRRLDPSKGDGYLWLVREDMPLERGDGAKL
ncbi:hypothetical protein DFJ74DRAFT_720114 [Hyaloraphidium curvatum]|nr:hypothetical protein DFJ74DRAFT_720114 [Hyaloraphidium curvatum]